MQFQLTIEACNCLARGGGGWGIAFYSTMVKPIRSCHAVLVDVRARRRRTVHARARRQCRR
eukprot:9203425-Lingulodinium_polyedra.AAC.1